MAKLLVTHMQLDHDEANDIVVQMRSVTQYLKQADSTLYPMVDLLRDKIDRQESQELSIMLQAIAASESPINPDQINFILRFEERMGIGS